MTQQRLSSYLYTTSKNAVCNSPDSSGVCDASSRANIASGTIRSAPNFGTGVSRAAYPSQIQARTMRETDADPSDLRQAGFGNYRSSDQPPQASTRFLGISTRSFQLQASTERFQKYSNVGASASAFGSYGC